MGRRSVGRPTNEAVSQGFEASDKFQAAMKKGKIKIDTGHFRARRWPRFSQASVWGSLYFEFSRNAPMATAVLRGRKLSKPIPFAVPLQLQQCGECGEKVDWMFDGKRLFAQKDCPYAEGLPGYSVEIDFPSGKMVFANDFRSLYDDDLPSGAGELEAEGPAGSKRVFDNYGSVGMGHGFVGNSCPGVYRRSKELVVIANGGSIEGTEENDWKDTELPPDGEQVGSICTDLWWYSVADADDLKKRGVKVGAKRYKRLVDIVAVKPGRYRLTHLCHTLDRDDYSKAQDYAILERVGDC